MKKILSFTMALIMLMSICVPAFAGTLNSATPSGEIIVKTTTELAGGGSAENFEVIIPSVPDIDWETEITDVSYTVEAHLKRDGRVKVTVSGSGAMKTTDGAYSLEYSLTGAGKEFKAEVPTIYPAQTQEVLVNIPAENWKKAVVEEYSDILTYTAEIERV